MATTALVTTSISHQGNVAVLSVAGEIDLATAPALEDALAEVLAGDPPALVVDLSEVLFLSSTGLRLLVATHEKVRGSAQFAVVADGPATSRPIQLTGLDELFPPYPTLAEALAALR